MCIEQDQRGDYVLDTSALAEKLSIPPEYLRCQMRLGLVTSGVGAGDSPATRNITQLWPQRLTGITCPVVTNTIKPRPKFRAPR